MGEYSHYPQRKSIRLPDYDYSQPGAYFVTVATHQRALLFGQIRDGEMLLSSFGVIVRDSWRDLSKFHPHLQDDEFCVMPDHFHVIVYIEEYRRGGSTPGNRAGQSSDKTRPHETSSSLSEIMRGFKTFTARRINALRHTPGIPVWQRGYFEHIIRDQDELLQIRQYIFENPVKWASEAGTNHDY